MRPLGFAVASLLAGCVVGGTPADGPVTRSTGSMVRVDLSYTRLSAAEIRFEGQAHFVRYRAIDSTAVPTLLGFTDGDALAMDSCRVIDGAAELDDALAQEREAIPEVSLLEAGRIEIRGPIDQTSLVPHPYPELVPFVSGYVYGAPQQPPLTLVPGQTYQVVAEGAEEVGPFSTAAAAPAAFAGVHVAAYERGGDLDLRWDGIAGSPLVLEVKWAAENGARVVRCRATDDGAFIVPRTFLQFPAMTQTATVSASRLERSPLWASGVGRGDLTIALRDIVSLQVAP